VKRIRGLNPTLKQALILANNGMDYRDYFIKRIYRDRLECIHRCNGSIKDAYRDVVAQ
jgi:hypothetical protein